MGLGPRFARQLGPCAQRAMFSLHPKPAEDPSRQLVWYRVGCLVGLLRCDGGFPFQMEHLKACAEIAAQRTVNWQKFCIKDDCKQCCSFWLLVIHSLKNYLLRPPIGHALNCVLEIQPGARDGHVPLHNGDVF